MLWKLYKGTKYDLVHDVNTGVLYFHKQENGMDNKASMIHFITQDRSFDDTQNMITSNQNKVKMFIKNENNGNLNNVYF